MKEGFNPFYWMFIDSTYKGLECVLDEGNEGRYYFALNLSSSS